MNAFPNAEITSTAWPVCRETRGDRGDRDDQQGIEPQSEAGDDDGDADECEHGSTWTRTPEATRRARTRRGGALFARRLFRRG